MELGEKSRANLELMPKGCSYEQIVSDRAGLSDFVLRALIRAISNPAIKGKL